MPNAKHIEMPNGTIIDISGSGGGSGAVVPDYSNLIDTINAKSYIATQDCYIEVHTHSSNAAQEEYYVNDVLLSYVSAPGVYQANKGLFLSKGDVVSLRDINTHNVTIRVFGLKNIGGTTNLVAGNYEYSEEEKVIGKWIDGKPIYKKTFIIIDKPYSASFTTIPLDFTIDKLVNINGSLKHSMATGGGEVFTVPYSMNTLNYYIEVRAVSNTITYACRWGSAKDNFEYLMFTIQYTKTTDEPNSFKPEMISAVEIPVKHKYSTEEKVVGEWIDGKPIYEQTIIIENANIGSWQEYFIDLSDYILIKFDVCANLIYKNDNEYFVQNNYSENITGERFRCQFTKSKNMIEYIIGSTWKKCKSINIIIQYTKTTD